MTGLDALVADVRRRPRAAGLFLDFDGTLAPIVEDPAAARPAAGAVDLLLALHGTLGRLVVVSGRPLAFLAGQLPEPLELVGLYGLERRAGRGVEVDPVAAGWRAAVDDALAAAAELPPGVEVEPKGLSLTVHHRRAPEAAAVVDDWARRTAAATGLEARPAKRSVELHPPVATDKGTVVGAALKGLEVAAFVGDDAGDLPAFAALRSWAVADPARRVHAVAVTGADPVPGLVEAADAVVAGPDAVVDLLRALAAPAD